jgi:hypothetical protein
VRDERNEKAAPDAEHAPERKIWTEPKLRKVAIAGHTAGDTGVGGDIVFS